LVDVEVHIGFNSEYVHPRDGPWNIMWSMETKGIGFVHESNWFRYRQ